ncbi:MAG: hypothetical protein QJR13_05475 [Bacillota bacterium]|nr:hypothetical protein [Bacillota bacterium]
MEWVLLILGMLALAGALFWQHKQEQSFVRLQKEALEQVVRDRTADLELLVSDLTEELNQAARRAVSDLEERIGALRARWQEEEKAPSQSEVSAPQPVVQPAAGPQRVSAQPPRLDRRAREKAVKELAAQGKDITSIAKELGLGKGEVELILNLEQARAR